MMFQGGQKVALTNNIVKLAKKRLVKVIESKISGRVSVPDDKTIEKTLEGMGVICVSTEEKNGENLMISGAVNFDAYYIDAEKTLKTANLLLDFSEKVVIGDVESIAIKCNLKSVKTVKESDRAIAVSLIVETKVYGVFVHEESLFAGDGDGFYLETKEVEIEKHSCFTNSSFAVSGVLDEIKNKDSIIGVSAYTTVNKVVAFENYITVEGAVALDYLEVNGELLKKHQKTIDFTEEVPVLNMSPNVKIDYLINDNGVNLSQSEDDNAGVVVDVKIGVAVWGFLAEKTQIVVDCFSDEKVTSLTYSSLELNDTIETKCFNERKSLIIAKEDNRRMDEILFVKDSFIPEIKKVVCVDGMLEIEGVSKVLAVYKNYDADETFGEFLTDEFMISFPIDVKDNVCVDVDIKSKVLNYKNKAGKDITLFMDYDGVVSLSKNSVEQFVKSVEIEEDLPKNRSSIVLYKRKPNESVFDIAKSLCVSPDVVLAQNPSILDSKSTKVVVYRKQK